MMGTLGIWKKVNLYWNSWRDVQADQFHFVEVDLEDGTKDRFAASQFIMTELSKYEMVRTRYQERKIVFFWTPTAGYRLWAFRFRELNNAIADLNSAVEQTQASILAEYAVYTQKKEVLQSKIRKFHEEDAPHYAAMMENRSWELARKFTKRERRLYQKAISMLKRKINLLEKAHGSLALRRQRFLLSIATYYRYANKWHGRLPVQYLGDDHFKTIANLSAITPYEDALADAEEKLATYSDELGRLVI